MSKYLHFMPVVVFAICILVALLLAVALPAVWPAALAIAIAGAALALALRLQNNAEIGYLTDDITVLQEQNRELRKQADKNVEMLDELADVVEQVATLTADGGDITRAQVETLRDEVTEMRTTAGAEPQVSSDALEDRFAALEAELVDVRKAAETAQITAEKAPSVATATAATAAVATTATAASSDTGHLRSLIARASGSEDEEAVAQDSQATASSSMLAPVFRPELGTPVAFILRHAGDDTLETAMAQVGQAVNTAKELEQAGQEVLLFVQFSAAALAHNDVRTALLKAVDEEPALQRRLTLLTSQEGFEKPAQETLAMIANEGCKFALEGIRDWSLNLEALARDGMAYIIVDGPAMVRSAQEQGGDPRRLTQALGMHSIALVAGDVAAVEDIASVNTLEPALVTGEGIGTATALEAAV